MADAPFDGGGTSDSIVPANGSPSGRRPVAREKSVKNLVQIFQNKAQENEKGASAQANNSSGIGSVQRLAQNFTPNTPPAANAGPGDKTIVRQKSFTFGAKGAIVKRPSSPGPAANAPATLTASPSASKTGANPLAMSLDVIPQGSSSLSSTPVVVSPTPIAVPTPVVAVPASPRTEISPRATSPLSTSPTGISAAERSLSRTLSKAFSPSAVNVLSPRSTAEKTLLQFSRNLGASKLTSEGSSDSIFGLRATSEASLGRSVSPTYRPPLNPKPSTASTSSSSSPNTSPSTSSPSTAPGKTDPEPVRRRSVSAPLASDLAFLKSQGALDGPVVGVADAKPAAPSEPSPTPEAPPVVVTPPTPAPQPVEIKVSAPAEPKPAPVEVKLTLDVPAPSKAEESVDETITSTEQETPRSKAEDSPNSSPATAHAPTVAGSDSPLGGIAASVSTSSISDSGSHGSGAASGSSSAAATPKPGKKPKAGGKKEKAKPKAVKQEDPDCDENTEMITQPIAKKTKLSIAAKRSQRRSIHTSTGSEVEVLPTIPENTKAAKRLSGQIAGDGVASAPPSRRQTPTTKKARRASMKITTTTSRDESSDDAAAYPSGSKTARGGNKRDGVVKRSDSGVVSDENVTSSGSGRKSKSSINDHAGEEDPEDFARPTSKKRGGLKLDVGRARGNTVDLSRPAGGRHSDSDADGEEEAQRKAVESIVSPRAGLIKKKKSSRKVIRSLTSPLPPSLLDSDEKRMIKSPRKHHDSSSSSSSSTDNEFSASPDERGADLEESAGDLNTIRVVKRPKWETTDDEQGAKLSMPGNRASTASVSVSEMEGSVSSMIPKRKKSRPVSVQLEALGANQGDVDIWSEPPSTEKNIVFETEKSMSTYNTGEKARKGGQSLSIKAATLNKLIEHLTWPDYNEDDKLYAKILLSCIDFIAPPTLVLAKLTQRFRVPRKKGMAEPEWERDMQHPIQSRVCSVLKSWVDGFGSQLTEEFIQRFKGFLATDLNSKRFTGLVQILTHTMDERIKRDISEKQRIATPAEKGGSKRNLMAKSQSESTLVAWKTQKISHPIELMANDEIARQITIIDHKIWSSIKPWEIVKQVWDEEEFNADNSSLRELVGRFNKISNFVVASVLHCTTPKERSRIVAKWIKVAKCLRNLNNFNSLMAISAGINHTCIARLGDTFALVPRKAIKTMARLDRLMSVKKNWKRYRDALADIDGPCIPFLGLIVSDVVFVDEGNPDLVSGLINFGKLKQLYYNCVEPLTANQAKKYEFSTQNLQVEKMIQQQKILDANQIYQRSVALEVSSKSPAMPASEHVMFGLGQQPTRTAGKPGVVVLTKEEEELEAKFNSKGKDSPSSSGKKDIRASAPSSPATPKSPRQKKSPSKTDVATVASPTAERKPKRGSMNLKDGADEIGEKKPKKSNSKTDVNSPKKGGSKIDIPVKKAPSEKDSPSVEATEPPLSPRTRKAKKGGSKTDVGPVKKASSEKDSTSVEAPLTATDEVPNVANSPSTSSAGSPKKKKKLKPPTELGKPL